MEYRYMIYNNVQKCFQFPSICETTEKGANTLLFKFIGNDARKYRFEIKRVEKEEAYKIKQTLKDQNKAKRIKQELENIPFDEILELVKRNRGGLSMENEIKVGDYCRTSAGKIFKCSEIVLGNIPKDENKTMIVQYIVKHSSNLIDLIQCGDYVNGYPVRYITDIDTGINILCNFDLNEMRWIPLEEIDVWYEIVTKEMMESISYKVKQEEN